MKLAGSQNRRQFLKNSGAAGAGIILFGHAPGLHAAEETGVPEIRLKRLAKGANVCRWFRFTESVSKNYITEPEASYMRHIGLTHVRLCLQPKVVMDFTTGAVLPDAAADVELAIQRFQRAGLLVLVDIHNEDRKAEVDPAWQEAFVKFWSELAGRLKKYDPDLTIFEIINEPVFKGLEEQWNGLNARIAAAIREAAPQHTIMTSGANWGGIDGLKKLKLLEDRNVVYSFHCYDPFAFTHQGATWAGPEVQPLRGVPYPSSPEAVAPLLPALENYPGSKRMLENYGNQHWNKQKLGARFKEGIQWGVRNRVPLYCGEFGVFPQYARPEHRANWFRDFGEVLSENQIGWAVWGWDEGFGLSRKYVDGKPMVDATVASSLGFTLA